MKIKIKKQHKSISYCHFELPKFTVLTGKNGSGKTHLLEAIATEVKSEVMIEGKVIRNIKYIQFNGLNPKINENADLNNIVQHVKAIYNNYKVKALKSNSNNIMMRLSDQNTKDFFIKVLKDTKKTFNKLTEEDFMDSFDISFMGEKDSLFIAQFALIFKNYHRRQEENYYNEYNQSKGRGITKPVLTDQEFEKKYGPPPWNYVNDILKKIDIPYKVSTPEGTRKESSFIFKLSDCNEKIEISSKDLSTGEKVLMSLALAIYNTDNNVEKPEMLLIDEPDVGLHPSMSKKMVDILNKDIVKKSNIPTVITSHSPTTVIASEGISIYQLERGNSIPSKIDIQAAVETLSRDVPFLKISTDKRRQVFVESKYDVQYYELITNILARKEALPAEPIFIPARTSTGSNCTDVINVVNSLYDNGNEQIYGIIDWDKENNSTERVLVLGESERYNIESYLLDPLLMGLLFIRKAEFKFKDFCISSFSTYVEAGGLKKIDAQKIIDKILYDLNLPSNNSCKYKLYNGWELSISSSYNNYQGHELEKLYKEKYPFLNAYKREYELKEDVIKKVISDYPQYSPVEIFNIVKRIK